MRSLYRGILFVLSLMLAPAVLWAQPVDPKASFYRYDGYLPDPARPTFIDLRTVTDGTMLYMFPRGRYMIDYTSGDVKDIRQNYWLVAMFVTDTTLFPTNAPARLHGVQSDMPEAYVPLSPGGLDRNVAYDFIVSGDMMNTIKPVGSNWLAVAIYDDVYYDNTVADPSALRLYVNTTALDPDVGNCKGMAAYNLRCVDGNVNAFDPQYQLGGGITDPTTTPEPASWALVGGGLLGMFMLRRRRKYPRCTPEQYEAERMAHYLASQE